MAKKQVNQKSNKKAVAKPTVKSKPVKTAKKIASIKKPVVSTKKAKVDAKLSAKNPVDKNKKIIHIKSENKNDKNQLKKTSNLGFKIENKIDASKLVDPNAEAQQAGKLLKPKNSSVKSKLKSKKTEKKQEDDFDDALDDDFGDSEIAEYEDDLKAVEDDEDDSLDEFSDEDDSEAVDAEVYLTDSEGRRLCRVRDCDQVSTVEGYCRYHYLLLWKKIQIRKSILLDGKLDKYIFDLTGRYPDKFLEMIKKDMKSEKDFLSAIQELEIDESAISDDAADDEVQSFADEIRGVADSPASLDDDGDF